MTFVAAVWY